MTKRFKGRESLSAALLTVGTLLMLLGPLTALGAALVAQTSDLVAYLQSTIAQSSSGPPQTLADLPVIGPGLRWLHQRFGLDAGQIQQWIVDNAQHVPAMLAGLSGKLFLGALNTVVSVVLMLFFLFFFIRDGHQLVAMLRDLTPIASDRRDQLVDHMSAVTRAVVFGSGITALVQGALVGLAFLITGLKSPLVFGMIAAFLALLPAGGTALVWIPAVVILAARDHWGMAVVMLIFGVLSSSIDNVLRPLLISGRVDVGTLTVFLGVLGGAAAFGLIGLFLGPVALALIVALMNFARDQRKTA
jgi:predicted PurR-regulated permease PerM